MRRSQSCWRNFYFFLKTDNKLILEQYYKRKKKWKRITVTANAVGGNDHEIKAVRKKWRDSKNAVINKPQVSLSPSHACARTHTHTHAPPMDDGDKDSRKDRLTV